MACIGSCCRDSQLEAYASVHSFAILDPLRPALRHMQVADAAGIGGQLMTVADAKTAIRQLVADFKANAAAASAEEVSTAYYFCAEYD